MRNRWMYCVKLWKQIKMKSCIISQSPALTSLEFSGFGCRDTIAFSPADIFKLLRILGIITPLWYSMQLYRISPYAIGQTAPYYVNAHSFLCENTGLNHHVVIWHHIDTYQDYMSVKVIPDNWAISQICSLQGHSSSWDLFSMKTTFRPASFTKFLKTCWPHSQFATLSISCQHCSHPLTPDRTDSTICSSVEDLWCMKVAAMLLQPVYCSLTVWKQRGRSSGPNTAMPGFSSPGIQNSHNLCWKNKLDSSHTAW